MTFEELQDILQKAKNFVVVAGGQIDRNKPEVEAMCDAYFFLNKKKVGVGTCRNCIFDAYFELKQITNEKFTLMTQTKLFVLKRFPIYFGARHQHYTNANITDAIAIEMVQFNRVNAANFENPEALLAAVDALKTKAPAASAPVTASPAVKSPTAAPVAPAGTTVNTAEKTDNGIAESKKVVAPAAPVAPAPVAAPAAKTSRRNQNRKKK